MTRAVLVLALAGCPAKHAVVENVAIPPEGTSIAVYLGREPGSTIAMIDDRRRLTVAANTLTLDRVASNAQPLVIEALDQPLQITACTRERTPGSILDELAKPRPQPKQGQPRQPLPVPPPSVLAPNLSCHTNAASGTYLVRVLQTAPLPSFKTFHQITYAGGDRAQLQTRFAFTALPWGKQAASLSIFDGLPASGTAPKPIAKSSIALDGTTTTLAIPPASTTARIRVVYDGAIRDSALLPSDIGWGRESRAIAKSILELDDTDLTVGQIDVHFEGVQLRDATVMPADRERLGSVQRLTLEAVSTLRPSRRSYSEPVFRNGTNTIKQKITIAVTNVSTEDRAVSIEEPLRPKLKRQLGTLPPNAKVIGDVVRADVVIKPQATETIEFTVTYTL